LPLSAKARVEVYIPDQPDPVYQDLVNTLSNEFAETFGGSTLVYGLAGKYSSDAGEIIADPITLLYTDTSFDLEKSHQAISRYVDNLRQSVFNALDEEEVLVAVHPIYHSI
jgi:hypothetical protein